MVCKIEEYFCELFILSMSQKQETMEVFFQIYFLELQKAGMLQKWDNCPILDIGITNRISTE